MNVESKRVSGFTIVELLIVIIVIAILATISVVAYRGVQAKASNAIRSHDVMEWEKIFQLYKAQYGSFPDVPTGRYYCLGKDFPFNTCRDYWDDGPTSHDELDPDNVTLMAELRKVSPTLPSNNPKPVRNSIVGPYMYFWGDGFSITQPFEGNADDCPTHMEYVWDNGGGILLCQVSVE